MVIITGCAQIPSWMKKARNTRIINGENAISPIPWQVVILIEFNSPYEKYICGGTILNEETILSAAHCFEGEIKVIVLCINLSRTFNFCKIYRFVISRMLMKQNFLNIYIITDSDSLLPLLFI